MSFDLENYEDVNTRIIRFRQTFPTGRLEATIEDINIEKGYVLIKANAYKEYEDIVPSATDYALGMVVNFNTNMKKWFLEDTVTSAYGRVISLLIPTEKGRSTRQDMERVERLDASPTQDVWAIKPEGSAVPLGNAIETIASQLGGEIVEGVPLCSHGRMVWKEGVGAKGKYQGYVCPSKVRTDQCRARWQEVANNG